MTTRNKILAVLFYALAAAFVLAQGCGGSSGGTGPTLGPVEDPIQTTHGPITGLVSGGVKIYKGVPYAAPPVGNLRWRPPQAPTAWTDPLNCTAYGAACPQGNSAINGSVPEVMDEDCLYLNVWTPAEFENEALPVMVWIHGGGFIQGAGSEDYYEATELAGNQNVVVVTINYRLGIFGFFAHPELSAEQPDNLSGNYGIRDQISALKWVRDNAVRFGGDPNNVTIFGESAGGVSVTVLMASPEARGLFHRAVCQSAGASKGLLKLKEPTGSNPSMEQKWVDWAEQLDIYGTNGALLELRALSWQTLVEWDNMDIVLPGSTSSQTICIDGKYITEDPVDTFAAGEEAPVPLMIGTTENEGSMFAAKTPINTVLALQVALALTLGENASDAMELYDVQTDDDARRAWREILTDGFVYSARRTLRLHAAAGNAVYKYHFARATNVMNVLTLGSYHGCEIPYLFGTFSTAAMGYGSVDYDLSAKMMQYWGNFARTGDPGVAGLVTWNAYNETTDNHLNLDDDITEGYDLRKPYCDFLEELE